jgi:hypothetical protein
MRVHYAIMVAAFFLTDFLILAQANKAQETSDK